MKTETDTKCFARLDGLTCLANVQPSVVRYTSGAFEPKGGRKEEEDVPAMAEEKEAAAAEDGMAVLSTKGKRSKNHAAPDPLTQSLMWASMRIIQLYRP